jgi:hypothetical protein
MPTILAPLEAEIRRFTVRSQSWEIVHETISQKYPTHKRGCRVVQVVEGLFSK